MKQNIHPIAILRCVILLCFILRICRLSIGHFDWTIPPYMGSQSGLEKVTFFSYGRYYNQFGYKSHCRRVRASAHNTNSHRIIHKELKPTTTKIKMGLGGQVDQAEDVYVCSLPEDVQKLALEELREDENIRDQSLAQMREWINKHPNIKRCRTDTLFLLRFLRTKKFSVPQACEMLERYLTIRQLYPQWFQKLDCDDKEINEIIEGGYLLPLLEKDRGRTVIFSNVGRFDPHKHSSNLMARVHSMVTETLCDDEVNQVQGYTYINDESGFSMAHVTLWSLLDVRNMLRCIQHSTPMRHKANHFINIPSCASKFLEFGISLLSEKLRSRIKVHKTMEDLHADINPKILPKEYGGTVPLADMIEDLKKKLKDKREQVVGLDDMYIEINEKECKLFSEMNEELGLGIDGTFKKLTVD